MFNKISRWFGILAMSVALVFSSGCTRIEDGKIGVRMTANGTIEQGELQTGWHQSMIGSIYEFPIRDISLAVDNMNPLTSENTALADFDFTVIYSVNPASVAELYKGKSRSFHAVDDKSKDVYLMYNYMQTLVRNAAYKAVREFKSLEAADNRPSIEAKIRENILQSLKDEKLQNDLIIQGVQVRNISPNKEILDSSTALVRSQNDLKVKQNEIAIAKAEAERQAALAQNAGQSISYMDAQARLMIAEAIKNGKVQTIIVPSNMTSLMIPK